MMSGVYVGPLYGPVLCAALCMLIKEVRER